ncbi:MAG TPA: ClpXP protease specificity-enhancing factor SspB [Dongiaceae bacterium]
MAKDELGYDKIVERQLRGVAREVLSQVAAQGLPGDHHFYVSFRTDHPEASVGANLKAQFPHEITIVLQHQFWGLEVNEDAFEVTLSFSGKHERLHVPFEALVSFSDPSVKFGLQFEPKNQPAESQPREDAAATPVELPKALPKSKSEAPAEAEAAVNSADDSAGDKASTVITLDAFRKKH